MTSPAPDTALAAATNHSLEPASKRSRWGKSLLRTGLWFGAAFLVTAGISNRLPGHPIVVRTNSIDTGVYWLDLKAKRYLAGDTVTFDFLPRTSELQERMSPARHTKFVLGLPGDVIKASESGELQVCSSPGPGATPEPCKSAGIPLKVDSQGRPLTPWVAAGKEIRLADKEFWVYAPNPKSLDSRYNGPVLYDQILGKAKPLYIWGSYLDE